MIAHIYPSVLQAVSGRGYSELLRILIPRTSVNKGKEKDRSLER